MAGFLEHVSEAQLALQQNEQLVQQELVGLRNQTQACFFKLVVSLNHPEYTPDQVSSEDPKFELDFIALFTDGTREWFDTWWTDTERTIKAKDDPTHLAQQALKAYRTLH